MGTQESRHARPLSAPKLEFAAGMFKMLGHPLRLQLVEMLDLHGEKTVNELAELCGQPQPTVSLYLNRLKTLGLLGCRRKGNQSYYSLAHPQLPTLLECVRSCPFPEGADL
jgi:DNA-binding transcriptional ArsR family regulator